MANLSLRERVSPFVVVVDGKLDVEASKTKFGDAITEFYASQEGNDVAIREALGAVFDQYKGAHITAPALSSAVITLMREENPALRDPKVYAVISKRILEVVREDGAYNMRRGASGGWCRTADQPVAAPTATK